MLRSSRHARHARRARRAHHLVSLGGVAVALVVCLPRVAHAAYIDPGTGSLAWQVIMSVALGGAFYTRRAIATAIRTVSGWLHSRRKDSATRPSEREAHDR